MMNGVLKDFIGDFCNVYVDDIIIYSRTEEEHCSHVSQILEALSKSQLKINKKKSEFFQRKVVFLGRVLDGFTKTTKEQSVQRIKEMRKPYDVHSLRVFLGLAGHFRAFIKDFAAISRCLTRLTQKEVPFVWSDECDRAYEERAISSDPIPISPDPSSSALTCLIMAQEQYYTNEIPAKTEATS